MLVIHYGCKAKNQEFPAEERQSPYLIWLYYVEEGNAEYCDHHGAVLLKKNGLYLLPVQKDSRLILDSEKPLRCLYMHADIFPYYVQQAIKIEQCTEPQLIMTLKLMQMQLNRADGDSRGFSAFGTALIHLLAQQGFLKQHTDHCHPEAMEMLSLTSNIRDISRKAGYTSEHFIRSFARLTGITPYQYLLAKRMNEAVTLMQQGYTLEEIAPKVGYASAKSFSGAFKRHYGIAPQYYREHILCMP